MAEIVHLQPILPAEEQWLQAELNYVDDEPPGIFPENQDSNWGLQRRIFSKQQQDLINQLNIIYSELFVRTSSVYLDVWEAQLGLPVNPPGVPIESRRARLLARMKKGAFTDALRASVIEPFLIATFGEPVVLVPEGIPVTAAGIPLYGETAVVTAIYRVYDNIENFSYEVWIKSTNTPDLASLQRELQRITPAGITFNIDNTRASILDYTRTIIHDGPGAYWRLGANFNNSTTLTGMNGTAAGGLVAGNGVALAQNTQDADGTDFDGTDDSLSIPDHALLKSNVFSVEAWVRPDVADGAQRTIARKGPNNFILDTSSSLFRFGIWTGGVIKTAWASTVSAGSVYHIVGVCDGVSLKLYVNGALVDTETFSGQVDTSANPLYIGTAGASAYWNGVIDEVAFYEYPLTADQVRRHYNVGTNNEAL
jgi:hypothetical protein